MSHLSAQEPGVKRLEPGVLTRCTSDTSLPGISQYIQQYGLSSGTDSRLRADSGNSKLP